MARAAADWRACCAVAEVSRCWQAGASASHRGHSASCRAAPQAHTWWQQAHLLPHPTRTVATQLRAWGADPPALAALAGVAAFMHPAWRQVQLARAARGEQVSATGVSEPRLSTNLLTSSVAEGLEGWGLGQEAARLRTAMAACQRAARLVGAPGGPRSTSSGTFVAAAARSAGRQRADFWRAAKRLWQVSVFCVRVRAPRARVSMLAGAHPVRAPPLTHAAAARVGAHPTRGASPTPGFHLLPAGCVVEGVPPGDAPRQAAAPAAAGGGCTARCGGANRTLG